MNSRAQQIVTASPASGTIAWRLAEFVHGALPKDLPSNILHEGKRSFVNWLACAIGGSQHPIAVTASRALGPLSGPATATLIGMTQRADVLTAALINCLSSSAHAFDDTHADMVLHPTGPVAASILALAELSTTKGDEFLLALILGIEVECRLARAIAVAPAKCEVGWYLTGLTGGVGAAAAAGRLLGLSVEQLVWAMGMACGQASGTRAMHGSMCSPLVPAHAGHTGLRAALMARDGFTCTSHYIEGDRGFLELFSEKPNAAALTEGLGEFFEVSRNTYKPYPCGIVIHPVVDAVLGLSIDHDIHPTQVARILVKANPVAVTLSDRPNPRDAMQAKISMQHWVATTLIDREAGIGQLERFGDQDVVELRKRVTVYPDPSLSPHSAQVSVQMNDGAVHVATTQHAIGSAENPMSDADLTLKFRTLARGVVTEQASDNLLRQCWQLDSVEDTGLIGRTSQHAGA